LFRKNSKEKKLLRLRSKQLSWILKKRNNLPENLKITIQKIVQENSTLVKNGGDKELLKKQCEENSRLLKNELKSYKQNGFMEFVWDWGPWILAVIIIKSFVLGSFRVPTGSMVNTIYIGDHLFVNMFKYGLRLPFADSQFVEFTNPKQGEVITFIEPGPEKRPFVKRVIGLPGDKILIDKDTVTVNGKALERKFVGEFSYASSQDEKTDALKYEETLPNGKKYIVLYNKNVPVEMREAMNFHCPMCMKEFVVPERSLFVMGDNRDNSLDSRYFGFVPRDNLQGSPWIIWFSVRMGELHLERVGTFIK